MRLDGRADEHDGALLRFSVAADSMISKAWDPVCRRMAAYRIGGRRGGDVEIEERRAPFRARARKQMEMELDAPARLANIAFDAGEDRLGKRAGIADRDRSPPSVAVSYDSQEESVPESGASGGGIDGKDISLARAAVPRAETRGEWRIGKRGESAAAALADPATGELRNGRRAVVPTPNRGERCAVPSEHIHGSCSYHEQE